MINKCWKFQVNILILLRVMVNWLKIFDSWWSNPLKNRPILTGVGHQLPKFFSALTITLKQINISTWNFQDLFITFLGYFFSFFRKKLWTRLETIFVEKKVFKNLFRSRTIWVTQLKQFLISRKKWRFEIFWTSAPSRASGSWLI